MQSEDAQPHTLLWENLNTIVLEKGVLKVNFEGFIADNVHANWNVVRKFYSDGGPTVPLEGYERTCLFHWSANLDKITQREGYVGKPLLKVHSELESM